MWTAGVPPWSGRRQQNEEDRSRFNVGTETGTETAPPFSVSVSNLCLSSAQDFAVSPGVEADQQLLPLA